MADDVWDILRTKAVYEGSQYHKKHPGDFGLRPPPSPRPDATLCDEAGVFDRATANALFKAAIDRGVVSIAPAPDGLPKCIWAVDASGQVYEAMNSGNRHYHGYPVRRSDVQFDIITQRWAQA
ncbi:MAG: hypothetical protein EPO26_04495 [Chloroflexota bacterium]|nr:MAG: hypothetical protein EPO26_04495 [Chloroflexota bacterium]